MLIVTLALFSAHCRDPIFKNSCKLLVVRCCPKKGQFCPVEIFS